MNSSAVDSQTALAIEVTVSDDTISVELADGRSIAAPLAWYPRLLNGAAAERNKWRLIGGGRGIHWPALDEDISVANLIAGRRSSESQTSLQKWLDARSEKSSRKRLR